MPNGAPQMPRNIAGSPAKGTDDSTVNMTREILTELIPVLTPAAEVGKHYGAIRADLEKSGMPFDRVAALSVANRAA